VDIPSKRHDARRSQPRPALPGCFSLTEGDLIIGTDRSAIGTLVERTSRHLKLIHLPHGHSAEDLRLALVTVMLELPDHTRLTLTWDQGSEMARHDMIAGHFSQGVFFAHPGRPWQRGSNENIVSIGDGSVGPFSQAGVGSSR